MTWEVGLFGLFISQIGITIFGFASYMKLRNKSNLLEHRIMWLEAFQGKWGDAAKELLNKDNDDET